MRDDVRMLPLLSLSLSLSFSLFLSQYFKGLSVQVYSYKYNEKKRLNEKCIDILSSYTTSQCFINVKMKKIYIIR